MGGGSSDGVPRAVRMGGLGMWEFAIKYPFLFTALAVFVIVAARDVLVAIFSREE